MSRPLFDGYDSDYANGIRYIRRISSNRAPLRLPAPDCGCRREHNSGVWTLHLCARHQVEQGIVQYCLEHA